MLTTFLLGLGAGFVTVLVVLVIAKECNRRLTDRAWRNYR